MKLATGILRTLLVSGISVALAASAATAGTGAMDPEGAVGSVQEPTTPGPSCARVNVCTGGTDLINGEALAGAGLVWQTNFNLNELLLVDFNNSCQVLQRCPAPGASAPTELTLLNGVLYHYDFGTNLLYAIDPSSCQIITQCDPPGDDLAEGLTSDGQFLWRGDSQFLYRFTPPSPTGGGCQVVAQCPNPSGDSADGLTFCGENLLMLGYSGNLYEIDPLTCSVIGSCQLNDGASGNGITSDRIASLYVDDAVTNNLDRVDVGCDIPVPADPTSWGYLKVIYR